MRTINQGTEFKKIETLQKKAIRIRFLPNNAPVSNEMHKLRIIKLKYFITLQNILFVYECLEEERMKSFNTTFKQMETNQFYNTRSFNTHQLRKRDFKTKIWLLLYIEQMFIRLEPTPKCFKN